MDERHFGSSYRHVWSVGLPAEPVSNFAAPNSLFHHDLASQARQEYAFGATHVGGEFVFVPAEADAQEGVGWLLGLVVDTATNTTELRILDAQSVGAGPVARIQIPHRVPPGFHGNWIPDLPDKD